MNHVLRRFQQQPNNSELPICPSFCLLWIAASLEPQVRALLEQRRSRVWSIALANTCSLPVQRCHLLLKADAILDERLVCVKTHQT